MNQAGVRPSLLSPSSSPSSSPAGAAGIRLLDAIEPGTRAAASSMPRAAAHKRRRLWGLWGLAGVMTLGALAAWMAATRARPRDDAWLARAPAPAAGPASHAADGTADRARQPGTPAQIVPLDRTPTPAPTSASASVDVAAATAPITANAPAADAKAAPPGDAASGPAAAARRAPPSRPMPAAARHASAKNKSTPTARHAGAGAVATARPPAAQPRRSRSRSDSDPDADVVAAIMAGMDRRTSAAPAPAASRAVPGAPRP